MKNKNETGMELDRVTVALVLRLSPTEIESLQKTINEQHMNVIYRATSYAPLYITKEEPE